MKQGTLVDHLDEDAGDAPDVKRAGIAMGAQQHLWSPVPQSHHLRWGEGSLEGEGERERKRERESVAGFHHDTKVQRKHHISIKHTLSPTH